MQTQFISKNSKKAIVLNYDVIKTVWHSLGASNKVKNDITSGYPADSKLSENVLLLILIHSQGASKQTLHLFRSYIKITKRGQICPPPPGTNRVKLGLENRKCYMHK